MVTKREVTKVVIESTYSCNKCRKEIIGASLNFISSSYIEEINFCDDCFNNVLSMLKLFNIVVEDA
jgi:hypothetical protein